MSQKICVNDPLNSLHKKLYIDPKSIFFYKYLLENLVGSIHMLIYYGTFCHHRRIWGGGGGGVLVHAPYRTQFFHFRIHFH